MKLAFRLARRELRGGLRGFGVFLLCLTIGVAAIAGVGTLSAASDAAIRADARQLLGGDLDLHQTHVAADGDLRAFLGSETAGGGRLSETVSMRAIAVNAQSVNARADRRSLVELKAVDAFYPLFGTMRLAPDRPLAEMLAARNGVFGAVVEESLIRRLGLKVGDSLRIGEALVEVRALIELEPDRGISAFSLGPRLMVSSAALPATALIQPGSLIQFNTRIALPPGGDSGGLRARLNARFPAAGWHIHAAGEATPGLARMTGRLTLFLTLVGLTALLVGGIGVGNAVRVYLETRARTIAIFKCLGASGGLVFAIYLIQILILASAAILAGLALGALAPLAGSILLKGLLPANIAPGLYPQPLLVAALFGLFTALAFTLWPLGRARETAPAGLFRDRVAPATRLPRAVYIAATLMSVAALAVVTLASAADRPIAAWFIGGAAAVLLVFKLAGYGLRRAAGRAGRGLASGRVRGLRLALANIARPGSPTDSILVSVGAGLAVLVAIALIQGNLTRQIGEQLPDRAPSFFFINILADEALAFDDLVRRTAPDSILQRMPSLRGRITALNGVPVERAIVAPEARWGTDSDRGLTYAAAMPAGTRIIAGDWWPETYEGPPLISFDSGLARGMGLATGDTVTLNILGQEVVARIANLREVDWRSLGMNFTFIFAPGTLEAAPHTFIATARTSAADEESLYRVVTDRFPNITAVRVKEALDAINAILASIGAAVRATAALTLVAGVLVLAGAVAASHHGRVRDAVILKVLGATRRDVLYAYLIEFGLLGLAAATLGVAAGTAAAWAVTTSLMHGDWVFLPGTAATTAAACVAVTAVIGFAGTWRALGRKVAPLLRAA